ncbi:MAG: M15 family metallopeptidase [Pseudomonadales bacterium]|jgi:D-alanyl-D-alanine carboxypeptidase|nr:M15 family metallopeptidase [Pseudomonadales bacterium]
MQLSDIHALHAKLGIPADYASRRALPLQNECDDLVATEPDVFGRQAQLERATGAAWSQMRRAAAAAGVTLQLVSAYRSIVYQAGLIENKLARGQTLETILAVSAAPGYSEHHSGRALDIGTPGFAHLEEEFEHSPAFAWLRAQAGGFGFRLSFPRGNPHGVLYEPWHWYYAGPGVSNHNIV